MTPMKGREAYIASIDHVVRLITWEEHKQALHTLNRPDIGLTIPQMITLFAIRATGTCRMSELADITQQSAGTLTGIVDRLIDDGLVGRVRAADDRRVVQVVLTPAGEERLLRVEQARCNDMSRVLNHFDIDELDRLDCLLQQLLYGIHSLLDHEKFPALVIEDDELVAMP